MKVSDAKKVFAAAKLMGGTIEGSKLHLMYGGHGAAVEGPDWVLKVALADAGLTAEDVTWHAGTYDSVIY